MTTGCSAEYNLEIEDNRYIENINVTSNNSKETANFNKKWTIPVDKEEYNILNGKENNNILTNKIYNQKNINDTLNFNYDFSKYEINNSTAISMCYNNFNIINNDNQIIISTSDKATCFDKIPVLDNVKVNIKIKEPVVKHNADTKINDTYTWNITKNNASNKSIKIIANKRNTEIEDHPENNSSNEVIIPENHPSSKKDYTLYIFLGILLLIFIIGYLLFQKAKKSNSDIDD